MSTQNNEITLRKPVKSDGYAIHQLIAESPPLDVNSVYSYYLLSDHFRDTCVVAEFNGKVEAFLSAYLIPARPDTLFVWQVVVSKELRGQGIAGRMLEDAISRSDQIRYVEATVNPSNLASRGLFERLASQKGTTVTEETFLEASAFGPTNEHESEILLRIPLQ